MFRLIFVENKRPSYWLIDEVTLIGAHLRNHLVLTGDQIASYHAKVWLNAGSFNISACDEKYPVLVNGVRVIDKTPLSLNDQIQIGDLILKFVDTHLSGFSSSERVKNALNSKQSPWKLVVTEPQSMFNQQYPVPEALSIGRDMAADIIVPDHNVSRLHAVVVMRDNHLWIKDLNSSNGTLVNGISIQEQLLAEGDEVKICHLTFKLARVDDMKHQKTPQLIDVQQSVEVVDSVEDAFLDKTMVMVNTKKSTRQTSPHTRLNKILSKEVLAQSEIRPVISAVTSRKVPVQPLDATREMIRLREHSQKGNSLVLGVLVLLIVFLIVLGLWLLNSRISA